MIDEVVGLLREANKNQTTTQRPSQHFADFDLQAGYSVGRVLDADRQGSGHHPVGRKIGLTNIALWPALGIDTPIWGNIYEETVRLADFEGLEVSVNRIVQPRIETELVLRVNERIRHVRDQPEELAQAVEWVAIGFEIVQCHYPDWQFSAAEAVADYCLHSELIVGPRLHLRRHARQDLAAQLATVEVELKKDGQPQASGSGRAVVGSPLLALAHMKASLETQPDAVGLEPGDIVTTGTMTALQTLEPGQHWSVDVAGLGLVGPSVRIL